MSNQYEVTGCRTFTNGGTAIARGLRVKLSSGVLALAGDEASIGVTINRIEANEAGVVRLHNAQGTATMTAAGSFAVGATMYYAAGGKCDDSGTTTFGIALSASSGDGDLVEVLPD